MHTSAILLIALLGGPEGGDQGGSAAEMDAQACTFMRRNAEELRPASRPGLPRITDPMARLDSFTVDCGDKLLVWRRTLIGGPANRREGWQGRYQARWNAEICGAPALRRLVSRGWRLVDRHRSSNGVETVFEASCG